MGMLMAQITDLTKIMKTIFVISKIQEWGTWETFTSSTPVESFTSKEEAEKRLQDLTMEFIQVYAVDFELTEIPLK